MQKTILLLIPILALQMGCGQGFKTTFLTDSPQSQQCGECTVDTEQLDAKIVEAEAAIKDADAEMSAVDPGKIILDPGKLLNSGALKKILEKVRELISKLDELEAKIDAHLAVLDPVLHADLIAKLQRVKDRLARVDIDLELAKNKLVGKLDALIAKLEDAYRRLNPLLQLALMSKKEKLMNYLYDFREDLIALV